jgi:hypothetical protein
MTRNVVDTEAANEQRDRSSPASTVQSFFDDFDATNKGVPKNWMLFSGLAADVNELPMDLTFTDSRGDSAGIYSTLPSSVFKPATVATTIQAQIKSVSPSPVGNAICGLLGLPDSAGPTGYLAAGIDANGVVFIVEQQQNPKITQTIVPIGQVANYNRGPIVLTFTIKSTGVVVSAGAFNSGEISFSKNLNNFSLNAAFGNGAVPALVGASQPNQKGGSATFASISVSTAFGR